MNNYTRINKKTIYDTEIGYISSGKHLILTNYENIVIVRLIIFRPLKYVKHKILNLETILFSIFIFKFFRKQGVMLLTTRRVKLSLY